MRSVAAAITLVILGAGSLPAFADDVEVPAGTSVPLKFLAPMDSATVKEGIPVQFEVAADVLIGRSVIFRKGTPVEGTVTDVSQPGIFGQSARVHIGFIKATAVDGRPVGLSPLEVTPESIKQVKDVGAAAGSSVAGARQARSRDCTSSAGTSRSSRRFGTSMVIMSPSRTTAIGPPFAASGATWPIEIPWVAPENRPSVIRATSSPRPWPNNAPVT